MLEKQSIQNLATIRRLASKAKEISNKLQGAGEIGSNEKIAPDASTIHGLSSQLEGIMYDLEASLDCIYNHLYGELLVNAPAQLSGLAKSRY